MAKGLKPGQVPDWRPGAEYWRPLADGREVTIYPLVEGKGRLCVGPLADPSGYDIAYRYASVDEAVTAAQAWDDETDEHPYGYEKIEFGGGVIPKQGLAPVHSGALQVGTKLEMNESFKRGFNVTQTRQDTDGSELFSIEGVTEDGFQVQIEGIRRQGDPVGAEGQPIVTITAVSLSQVIR